MVTTKAIIAHFFVFCKEIDPYQHFIEESVEISYWEPQETELWFEFGAEAD